MTEFNLEEFKKGDFKVLIYDEYQYNDFIKIIKEDINTNIDWSIIKHIILKYINGKIAVAEYYIFDAIKILSLDNIIEFETLTFDSFYKDTSKAISPIHAYDILEDKITELLNDGFISTKEFATMLECLIMLGGKE